MIHILFTSHGRSQPFLQGENHRPIGKRRPPETWSWGPMGPIRKHRIREPRRFIHSFGLPPKTGSSPRSRSPSNFSEFAVDDSQSQSAEACSFRSHRPPIHLALGTHCDRPLRSDPSDPPRPRPCASGGADAAPHRGTDRRGHQQLRGGATGSTTEFPLAVWDHVRTGLFGAATPTLELSLTREQARRCLTI